LIVISGQHLYILLKITKCQSFFIVKFFRVWCFVLLHRCLHVYRQIVFNIGFYYYWKSNSIKRAPIIVFIVHNNCIQANVHVKNPLCLKIQLFWKNCTFYPILSKWKTLSLPWIVCQGPGVGLWPNDGQEERRDAETTTQTEGLWSHQRLGRPHCWNDQQDESGCWGRTSVVTLLCVLWAY